MVEQQNRRKISVKNVELIDISLYYLLIFVLINPLNPKLHVERTSF